MTKLNLVCFLSALSLVTSAPLAHAKDQGDAAHFKKITKAPAHAAEESEDSATDRSSDEPVVIKKPEVKARTSPGAKTESKSESKSEKSEAKAAHAGEPVAPDQALASLQNGNGRFLSAKPNKTGRSGDDRKRLLAGQHPHTIVLSCADSRVPPEVVFDQGLGEIFTIRVAGEALDASVIASVEYAVEHLGPRLLVVMGHTQCGAVDAALKVKEGESAGSESLDKLLADIRPRIKNIEADKISSNLEVESELNAEGVARDIVKRSEVVRKKVEAGELVIKYALYNMATGKVTFH